MFKYIIPFGIFLISFYFLENSIHLYTKNAKKIFFDKPNSRSMHQIPIPTGGGFLILISILINILIWKFFNRFTNTSDDLVLKIILISTPLSLISFYDDFKNISKIFRYLVHLITGLFLLFNSNLINFLSTNYDNFLNFIIIFLSLIFITSIINISNFMDGIDGLVVGSFTIIFSALAIKVDFSYVFIACTLCFFLRWNWSPAMIFMGDSGSTLLGSIYAGTLINASNIWNALAIFLMSMPLIIDSTLCIFLEIL